MFIGKQTAEVQFFFFFVCKSSVKKRNSFHTEGKFAFLHAILSCRCPTLKINASYCSRQLQSYHLPFNNFTCCCPKMKNLLCVAFGIFAVNEFAWICYRAYLVHFHWNLNCFTPSTVDGLIAKVICHTNISRYDR